MQDIVCNKENQVISRRKIPKQEEKLKDKKDEDHKNTKYILKDKVFKDRRSLLEQLYDEKHIRNIHNLFVFFLLVLFINQVSYGILYEKTWSLHFNLIYVNFADAKYAILGWTIQFIVFLLVFPVFHVWSSTHNFLSTHETIRKFWDYFWIVIVCSFYVISIKLSTTIVEELDLTFSSSVSILTEQTRLLMKTHAFIRGNAEKVLKNEKVCSFSHFLYFLFVPTLVYRDTYPRTKSINWLKVLINATEVCGTVILMCLLLETHIMPGCLQFKSETYHLRDILWVILRNTLPALVLILLFFYLILHAWQNLFGELLRFADREFYQDWWNCTSYGEYYRKWNIVVHDWLYTYIYKDCMEYFQLKSSAIPKFLVFFISSIFHEYIIIFSTRMFYPVLFVIFLMFGSWLSQVKSPKFWVFNVLFFYGFALGVSMNLNAYVLEYCARQNPCAVNSTNYPYDLLYSKTFFSECLV